MRRVPRLRPGSIYQLHLKPSAALMMIGFVFALLSLSARASTANSSPIHHRNHVATGLAAVTTQTNTERLSRVVIPTAMPVSSGADPKDRKFADGHRDSIFGFIRTVAAPPIPTNTSPGTTTSPGPTTASSSVTLSWNAASGATSYGLGVRDLATNVLVVDTNVSGTSFVANLSAGKQYRWNVNACNSTGCSSYTTPLYFQTPSAVSVPGTPTNTSPGTTSSPGPTMSGNSVTLSWNASGGATYYGLGVRDLATNVLVVDTNVSGTSYNANLSAGKQYRWNVNACNSAGCSSYTTPLYFQTPSAVSVPGTPGNTNPGTTSSPGPTTSGSSVTLSWSGSAGATYYGLGVRDLATNVLVVDTNVSGTSFVANLSAGKQYRWNVNACNSAGCSSYTTPLYFQTPSSVTVPGTPGNTSPGTTSSPGPTTASNSVTLSWSASGGATYYGLGVRDLATNVLVVDTNVSGTSFVANLSSNKQYRWNVNACNSAGCSSYTTPLYFQTPGAALLPAPTLSAPSNGATGVSNKPTFNWSSVSGANRYWLVVATSPSILPTDPNATTCPNCVISGNTDGLSYTAPNAFPFFYHTATLNSGTTYYWKVQGWNTGGTQGNYSSTYSFTTVGAATNPTLSVMPSSGPLGTAFTFTGGGFTHNNTATLTVTRPDGSSGGGGKYNTDSNGNVTFFVTSQSTDPLGPWKFVLKDDSSGTPASTQVQYTSTQQSGTDDMYFSASTVDVTIPDNTQLTAGSTFTKTWRLQNSGTTTWNNYTAVFIANPSNGNPSINLNASGATSASVPLASPGQTINLSISMRAPTTPGTYYSYWRLQNTSGAQFSAQFYVKIRVVAKQGNALGFGTETGQGGTNDSPPAKSGRNADPVNTATGNYNYSATDLRVTGRGLDVEMSRYYNSQDITRGPLGNGWSHSFNIYLTNLTASSASLHYSDGKVLDYTNQPGTSDFTSTYPGYYDTLVHNGDGTWTLKKPDQRSYLFDASGRLTSIQDRNSNKITLSYSGSNLSQVTDTVGRTFNFTYSGSLLTGINDPGGRVLLFSYDANANLILFRDANGNTNTYNYDANNRITRIIDGRGNNLLVNTYDANNRVSVQTNGRGNPWTFVYNPDGSTSVFDPFNKESKYLQDTNFNIQQTLDRNVNTQFASGTVNILYDENNNRARVSDQKGNFAAYVYDQNGNITARTDPTLNSRQAVYDPKNNPTQITDEFGKQTQMIYDALGNLTTVTDALNNSSSIAYDSFGEPLTIADANGNVTTRTYDAQGNLTSVKDALNNTATYAYDTIGRRTGMTDGRGKTTTFTYDANDNLLTVTDPSGNVTSFSYDANNNRTIARDARGNTTRYEHDENNLLVKETDPAGNYIQHTYDKLDRRVSTRDKRGNVTTFGYDNEGRLVSVTDPLAHTVTYTYDANGNRIELKDARGQITRFTYDALNRLTKIQDPLGNSIRKEYDKAGRLVREFDPRDNATQFAYDALGNLTQVTDAANGIAKYSYDKNSNRITQTDPNNHISRLAYDKLNRLVSALDPLNNTYTYTYDEAGNRASQTDAKGQTVRFTYDASNRLSALTYPDASTVRFTYDANGNVLQMTDALGVTTYVYDQLNRLTGYTDVYGKTIGYQYDANGNITALTYPDGKQVLYQYDAANRLASLTDWANKTTTYEYDAANLLTRITYPSNLQTTTTFTYDNAGRLIRKIDYPEISTYDITLDANGNRTSMQRRQYIDSKVENNSNSATYDAANRLQTAGPATFGFDANGNLTSKTENGIPTTYAYDFNDRLTAISNGTQYFYNGQGVRVKKIEAGVTTQYVVDVNHDLSQVLCETDGNGAITNYYVYGIGLAYKVAPNGNHYYYHFDPSGSTIAITDDSVAIINAYFYDPFGKVTNSFENTSNPFKFVGQYGVMEDKNGLLYMRARYYAPELGRFLNKDTMPVSPSRSQSLNLFAYANNNPANEIDPQGLWSVTAPLQWAGNKVSKGADWVGDKISDGVEWTADKLGSALYSLAYKPGTGVCGPQGRPLLEKLVPDEIKGVYNFHEVCKHHDENYSKQAGKAAADLQLLIEGLVSCIGSPNRTACVGAAFTYYYAVSFLGDSSYKSGQSEANKVKGYSIGIERWEPIEILPSPTINTKPKK
jgi:RHS repeat-associated protein